MAIVLAAGAVAVSSARPAARAATTFSRCDDLVAGGQPTTAPDGTLVYTYGYYVHSVRLDGGHDQTLFSSDTPVSSPSISPDGKLIAFDKGGRTSDEIWVMNRDGPMRATSRWARRPRLLPTERTSRSEGRRPETTGLLST